jgi:hypothetical protein
VVIAGDRPLFGFQESRAILHREPPHLLVHEDTPIDSVQSINQLIVEHLFQEHRFVLVVVHLHISGGGTLYMCNSSACCNNTLASVSRTKSNVRSELFLALVVVK